MAFAVTNVTNNSNYGSGVTSSSFTPPANSLLVAQILRRRANLPSSVTSGHGTFTLVNEVGGSNRYVGIYVCEVAGSPSSNTVTATFGTPNATGYLSVSTIESTAGQPFAVANSDAQSIYNGSGGPFTNTLTLSAFAAATNLTYIAVQKSGTTDPEAGYTVLVDFGDHEGYYLAAEDTSPSYTTTNTFANTKAVAFEVGEPGGGGGLLIPVIMNHLRNQGIS